MHLVVLPLPPELAPIGPAVAAVAIHLVVLELAQVLAALGPPDAPLPVLHALGEVPLVPGAIGPDLLAGTFLLVVGPLADVQLAVVVDGAAVTRAGALWGLKPVAIVHYALGVLVALEGRQVVEGRQLHGPGRQRAPPPRRRAQRVVLRERQVAPSLLRRPAEHLVHV